MLFYGIGKCSYSSGISTRIALAILGVQSAGFALFYGIGNCSYSSGAPARVSDPDISWSATFPTDLIHFPIVFFFFLIHFPVCFS